MSRSPFRSALRWCREGDAVKGAALSVLLLGLLAQLSASAAGLPPSARGTFVQRKILADVEVTLVSKGVFRFERDRFFEWDTREPVASVFHATPTNYAITVGGRTTTRALDIDVTSIDRLFEIKEMKDFVKSVKTEPSDAFPRRVCVAFRNGDRLEIDLKMEP